MSWAAFPRVIVTDLFLFSSKEYFVYPYSLVLMSYLSVGYIFCPEPLDPQTGLG